MNIRPYYAKVVIVLLVLAPGASAGVISLGTAANYAVYAGPSINTFSYNGPGTIVGNVAVGANGQINWASPATITGNLYEDTGVSGSNSGVTVSGSTNTNFSLSSVYADATSASVAAKALTANQTFGSGITNSGGTDTTITATVSGGQTVVDITGGITFSGSGNLVLSGGVNDSFIINVMTGGIVFSNESVLLSGGVTANHVLFNILGTGNALTINNTATFNGTYLVESGNVSVHDSTLNGQLLVVNNSTGLMNGAPGNASLQDTSGFDVHYVAFSPNAATPEPATMALFGLGLSGLAARFRKRKRS